MNSTNYDSIAAKLLAPKGDPMVPPVTPHRREDAIRAIEQALRARRVARRRRAALIVGSATAVAAAAMIALFGRHHEVVAIQADRSAIVAPPAPVPTLEPGMVAPRELAPVRRKTERTVVAPSTTADSTPPSVVAPQNDLFEQAIRARQRGDVASSVALFDRLLTTYPSGPLTEAALAEELRLLPTVAPARSKEVARRYLQSFPHGYARAEARQALGE